MDGWAVAVGYLVYSKRASGFPFLSLESCLSTCSVDPAAIDVVAMPGRYGRLLHRVGDVMYRRTNSN